MSANDFPSLDQLNLSVNSFYPRRNWIPVPAGAVAHMISVEDGVSLSCRFFPSGATNPAILFFYGNGAETSHFQSSSLARAAQSNKTKQHSLARLGAYIDNGRLAAPYEGDGLVQHIAQFGGVGDGPETSDSH